MNSNYKFKQDYKGQITLINDQPNWHTLLDRHLHALRTCSTYYSGLMERLGLKQDLSSLEILEHIPATTKEDYREHIQLNALSRSDATPFTTEYSSGSTSACVLRVCTQRDDLAELSVTETAFKRAGMGQGDCFVCIEVGSLSIHEFYFRAARNIGVSRNYFVHLAKPYKDSIIPIAKLKPTILLTIPSLLSKCQDYLFASIIDAGIQLKSFIYMGEQMPTNLLTLIKEKLKCPVFSFYGTTETGGIGASCVHETGIHFDPSTVFYTLEKPVQTGPETWRGNALVTSLNVYSQPVIKYRIGDILELNIQPCPCGDPLPRLRVISRTQEEFTIAAEKFSYSTFIGAFQALVPKLDFMQIKIDDSRGEDRDTLLEFTLPKEFEVHQEEFNKILTNNIFELDAMHRYGLVRFDFRFVERDTFSTKKTNKVIDNRPK